MTIDDAKLDAIVNQVLSELRAERGMANAQQAGIQSDTGGYGGVTPPAHSVGSTGIYPDVDSAVEAAQRAYEALNEMPIAIRKDIIAHMRQAGRENALVLSQAAWEETGMGRVEDKVQKNLLNANKTPGPEYLDTQAWSGDGGLTIVEYAPYGVIGSITPSTNPTSTIINNSISMISAGNAVVFNTHPGAKDCSMMTVAVLNQAVMQAGGPPDLLTCVAEPTIESAQQLMQHKGVRLLVVTGGAAVVREAMRSGKRAVCAGPGNPPVVVDETADLEQAGHDIVWGGSFDNNIVCTTEKTTFVVESVADGLIDSMQRNGGYLISSWQVERLLKSILAEDRGPGTYSYMNKDFIGKNANALLAELGINVGDDVRQVIADVPPEHQLVWSEQMMPIMPVVRMPDVDSAIDMAVESEHGFRHTAVMHSKHLDNLSKMARRANCSIFVKNGPSYSGLGRGGEGYASFTIASPTGEGLTTCRSFSRLRRCTLKDYFRIV